MTDEHHEALRQRIEALLYDTVSPKVTLDRVLLLLQARLPAIHGYAVWLTRDGKDALLVSGAPDLASIREPHRVILADAEGACGYVDLYLQEGAHLLPEEEEIVGWAFDALTPLACRHVV